TWLEDRIRLVALSRKINVDGAVPNDAGRGYNKDMQAEGSQQVEVSDSFAFFGAAHSGKTKCAEQLALLGWEFVTMSGWAKSELDSVITSRFGVSAWTNDEMEKKITRPILELWMELAGVEAVKEYVNGFSRPIAIERIYNVSQCELWKGPNRHIIWVFR